MTQFKSINIKYFASLKEATKIAEETLETMASTPLALFEELATRYNFPLKRTDLSVSVNDAFVSWEQELYANDTVVFIPPVAGG
jgi:molybdopterin converting factor small subunit